VLWLGILFMNWEWTRVFRGHIHWDCIISQGWAGTACGTGEKEGVGAGGAIDGWHASPSASDGGVLWLRGNVSGKLKTSMCVKTPLAKGTAWWR